MSGARERLAAEQAALLRALLAGGQPPAGFDEIALQVEADALLAKRRRVVAQLAPEVADKLEERYRPLFDEYARAHPRTVGSRAREDAAAFREWLIAGGHVAEPQRRWWRRT
ncbi:hypothetical protein [Actinokineospora xionganensis]|uniref:SCO6045-like C-terminal domain-containing protein n=1 Tax=Actinokineospora xionganensis TaxID=2684470 RepID=A0ABR7LB12_9PSEU|nr:hypothetical protein [Actinokineospora xionganensis]MBC6449482.1 hypothetical protein [Actinokineospora xionganensis]